jgi:transcriptional regulator with XRE-family HTH domain
MDIYGRVKELAKQKGIELQDLAERVSASATGHAGA